MIARTSFKVNLEIFPRNGSPLWWTVKGEASGGEYNRLYPLIYKPILELLENIKWFDVPRLSCSPRAPHTTSLRVSPGLHEELRDLQLLLSDQYWIINHSSVDWKWRQKDKHRFQTYCAWLSQPQQGMLTWSKINVILKSRPVPEPWFWSFPVPIKLFFL